MAVQIPNNNLIARAVTTQVQAAETNTSQVTKEDVKPDVFEKKETIIKKPLTTKEPSKAAKIIGNIVSLGLMVGLFFLPDLLFRRRTKAQLNLLDKAKNFKPAIGDILTGNKQEVLKNGKIKVTLENIKDKFKFNEIIIMDKGKIKQRIITKKELMPNGKYKLKGMQSYRGENLIDNAEIDRNEAKYLVKKFKRTCVKNKKYTTTVTRKGQQPELSLYHSTSNGEPVLKIKDTADAKENTLFLYLNDKCIGSDRQVIPKDKNIDKYNVLNIPRVGIKDKIYNLEVDGHQYDERLTQKLRENF